MGYKSFFTHLKKWVFITTDFITVNNKGSTMNNSPDSTTMMADSTITKKTDSTMNRNKTDFIMKDSTMKKNQVSTMNTSNRRTDSTTTTSRRMKTDFITMPKRDFTMMAMNRITKS